MKSGEIKNETVDCRKTRSRERYRESAGRQLHPARRLCRIGDRYRELLRRPRAGNGAPETINPAYATWSLDTLPLKLYPVQLQPKASVAKQANTLVKLIRRPDIKMVVHCGDPDDEGQLLVDEVLEFAGNTAPVKRALINDNTAPAVKKAINSLRDNSDFRGMYLKALMRSAGDAIFGFSMSRCYTLKARDKGYKGTISVGRVQTPVLGMIVRRWRDNQAHSEAFYYQLAGQFISGTDVVCARWQTSEYAPVDDKKRLTDKAWGKDSRGLWPENRPACSRPPPTGEKPLPHRCRLTCCASRCI
uniref:Omega-protein n=1 Tax=Salmonella enterica subsp. enterica serovar London TaxID=149390 RepID=A0A3G8EVI0_SALET|nr:DNA topoisomerase 3 [Salmonella enterica subsp. enterica serovar London]AZF85643.1 DNA topoisomerase 3 [Salmonella enterica subsp. enterica serovar London]